MRYADDFVVLHTERAQIEQAKTVVEQWLEGIGLHLSPTKTRIVHTLEDGFDFLGFTIRQVPSGKHHSGKRAKGELLGFKTIIKPSQESQERQVRKMKEVIRRLRNQPQEKLIAALNPIIKGWANYYRIGASKTTFDKMDHLLWYQLYQWARWSSPRGGKRQLTGNIGKSEQGKDGSSLPKRRV